MTPEIEKKRREVFESIYSLPGGMYWLESEKQYAGHTQFWLWTDRFNAFNAALDAVDIELPEEFDKRDVQGLDYDEVVAAITATGLGLKVKP